MTTSSGKMKSRVLPCWRTAPLTLVSTPIPAQGSISFGDQRADGAERVEAFGAGPLAVLLLQIARGHVIHAGVAENVGTNIFIRGQLVAIFGDHHSEFAFVVHPPGDAGPADHGRPAPATKMAA